MSAPRGDKPDAEANTDSRVELARPLAGPGSNDAFHFEPGRTYRETRAKYDAEFERRYVKWLLGRHGGNVSAAAREAKMDRKHL
ncbi:MAG: hypothetical protein FWD17_14000, partial [Polyangiaceae bacterium]|nr:hypothetical protein [Polyangiaceae bacterium]